jgi:hypothetical protein
MGGFNGHITAAERPMRANDSIPRAKHWLQTCMQSHAGCQKFHASTVRDPLQRPTRVLDVSGKSIRLRCDLKGQPIDYLVLSYMWGTNFTQQLRLLQSNFETFQREIPRDKFEASDIYKEAIRVTLALGYRYLWIDSLCIIQDSTPDWDYEARRMAIVYGNAVCNLAFLFPPHSPAKPTQRDDPRVWNPCILRPATSSRPGVYMEHMKTELRNDFQNHESTQDWLVQRNWPLFNRAWTFQEYLLSPRTLLLGHKNLMWQCSTLFYDELLGPIAEPQSTSSPTEPKRGKDRGKSRYFPLSIHVLSKAPSLSDPAVLSFMLDWQNLVNEYRSRNLSCGKDRIIAFAGIARAFSTLSSMTYLGGLWKEIMPMALLWYMDKKTPPLVRRGNGLPKGVLPASTWTPEITESSSQEELPGWSWFSVPIYRYYQSFFLFGDDEVFVRCKSVSNPELVVWNDIFFAEMVSFQFAGQKPGYLPLESSFFDFAGLTVTLSMRVFPVKADWPADLARQMRSLQATGIDRGFCWDPVLTYYPDDPRTLSPPRNAIYAIVSEFQIVRTAGKNTVQRRLAGLMLVPGTEAGTWKRVGCWKLRINISNVEVGKEGLAGVARRWRGVSVVSEKWQYVAVTLV